MLQYNNCYQAMDTQKNEEQITLKSSSDLSKSDRIEKNINDDQIDDQIDDEELQESVTSKMARKKVKCSYPIFLLLFFAMLQSFQVSPCDGRPLGVKCPKDSDIKIKNTKTGLIESCMPCPDCLPAEQYSIPCGSIVDIGTSSGRCEDCPAGTYSSKFDTKQCQACTQCTNKVTLRNCTKEHNAKCGGCIEGFKYDPINWSCDKDPKKTTTAPTTSPIATTAKPSQATTVLIPKSTKQNTTTTSTNTVPSLEVTSTTTSIEEQNSTIFSTPIPNYTTHSVSLSSDLLNHGKAPHNVNQEVQIWKNTFIGSFCGAAFLCLAVGVSIFMYKKYSRKWCHRRRSRGDDTEGTSVELMETTNDDQLMSEFIDNNFDQAESLYLALFKRSIFGTWDFEKICKNLGMEELKIKYFVELANVQGVNAVKVLLETLCTEVRPPITVKKFADSLKCRNRKAYNLLKPYFTKHETAVSQC